MTGARIHSGDKTDESPKSLTKPDQVGQNYQVRGNTGNHEQTGTGAGVHKKLRNIHASKVAAILTTKSGI